MRLQPKTISLGDKTWCVRPLTVAQVQAIEPLLMSSGDKAGSVASAVAILRVALGRDHAEAAASLDEIEAPASEIAKAMGDVLRLGGFLPDGDFSPGEGEAGTSPAIPASSSTGAVSMPG